MAYRTWTDAYQQWQEAADALVAKHKRVQWLAHARAEASNYTWDMARFYARYRIRFNQELDRISTP